MSKCFNCNNLNIKSYDSIIGKNMKKLRQDNGYTLQEIGNLLGVSLQQISKYEVGRDRLSATNLYKLSKYFNVDMRLFFNEKIQ